MTLARRYGAEIFFDETARAPWFRYWDEEGREHVVWFEDARSIQDKLLLAARYGMAGVGYWNLDRPFAQNWLVSMPCMTFIKGKGADALTASAPFSVGEM